jgi:predicted DNA-binding antitoxin AbrB/MazE fold protein
LGVARSARPPGGGSGQAASQDAEQTIEAIYEKGVLKPAGPLPLREHEKVRLTIEAEASWAERTAGMLRWTGDPEVLRRIATDPEFGILECRTVMTGNGV